MRVPRGMTELAKTPRPLMPADLIVYIGVVSREGVVCLVPFFEVLRDFQGLAGVLGSVRD